LTPRRLGLAGAILCLLAVPAQAGSAEAKYDIEHGDYAGARLELRALADNGDVGAQLNLAKLLIEGLGGPKDPVEAQRLLRPAALRGFAPAENMLAMLLWQSETDQPAAKTEAIRWFSRGAYHGDRFAQYNMGLAYRDGMMVPQRPYDAFVWLSLAAAHTPAGDKVFAERDAEAALLTPEQLDKARAQIAAFTPMAADALPPPPPAAPKPVQLHPPSGTGTGFFVTADGSVLTANHVVSGCREITLSGPAGKNVPASLAEIDAANDLALLKTAMVPLAVAVLRADPAIRAGDGVVAMGFPMRGFLAAEPSVTSGTVNALAGVHDDHRYLQFTAPVQPGNSGGPLLDMSGHVAGIVVAKLNAMKIASATGDMPQNVNFAVKQEVAHALLERAKIAYGAAPSPTDLKPADVADIARGAVVAIDCKR
jgi:hypothetical protein